MTSRQAWTSGRVSWARYVGTPPTLAPGLRTHRTGHGALTRGGLDCANPHLQPLSGPVIPPRACYRALTRLPPFECCQSDPITPLLVSFGWYNLESTPSPMIPGPSYTGSGPPLPSLFKHLHPLLLSSTLTGPRAILRTQEALCPSASIAAGRSLCREHPSPALKA